MSAGEPPWRRRITRLDAEIARVELPLAHVAVRDLDDEVRAERGKLVDATVAVYHEGAPGAELGERLGIHRRERRRVDAENTVAGAGRVCGGPRTLKTVRIPISSRTGATKRIAGWWERANMKPKPSSSIESAIRSGVCSRPIRAASSTSAEPAAELAALLPCFATAAPPPRRRAPRTSRC